MRSYLNNSIHVVGFTLVEMLVVISILLLLIAIAIPSFTGVVLAVHTAQSQAIIDQLDGAVGLYKQDFGNVPPSYYFPTDSTTGLRLKDSGGKDVRWYGCQAIVLYLTGYHQDPTNSNNTLYGWRTNRNSRAMGPYNGTEALKVSPGGNKGYTTTVTTITVNGTPTKFNCVNDQNPAGSITDSGGMNAHPAFLDAFGEIILYISMNPAAATGGGTGTTTNGIPFAMGGGGGGGGGGSSFPNSLTDATCADSIHNTNLTGATIDPNDGAYYSRSDYAYNSTGHDPNARHDDPTLQTTWSNYGTNATVMFASPGSSYYTMPVTAGGGHSTGGSSTSGSGSSGGSGGIGGSGGNGSDTTGQSGVTLVPYRSDYMLLSWGSDKLWYNPNYDTESAAQQQLDQQTRVTGRIKDDANNLYGK